MNVITWITTIYDHTVHLKIPNTRFCDSSEIARDNGIKIMRVDCTSHYSARAIAKLGFQCIYTLKYEDYKVNGEVVFKPKHPHNEVKIYLQLVGKIIIFILNIISVKISRNIH